MTEHKPVEIKLPSQDEMLQAVGRGIQQFAMVEFALATVFASLMAPADRADSVVALDAARHIETKMRVVQAVADRKLKGDQLSALRNLMNRCKRRANFRHKLAHWTVTHWPGVTSTEDVKRLKVALVPPLSSPDHMDVMWGGAPAIYLNEIKEFTENCVKLTQDLFDLANSLQSSS